MAVPYIFQNQVGPIPLSELDNNFSYFTDAITPSGGSINVFNSINAGTFMTAGTYLVTGTYATIGSYLTTGTYLTVGTNLTVNGTTNLVGGVTIPSASLSGNLTFTGTGNRILGDFTNNTTPNRLALQTSTTNGGTAVMILPNGTATSTSIRLSNNSDPTNCAVATLGLLSGTASLQSAIYGTGTYVPLTFYTSGVEKMRLDTSGNLGIGNTPSGTYKLEVTGNTGLTGTLNVTGASTLNSLGVTTAATIGTTLGVTGASTFTGLATFNGGFSNTSTSTFTGLATFNGGVATTTLTASSTSTYTGLATFNGGATFVGNVLQSAGTYSFSNASGTYSIGSTSGTATITVGQSTLSQTTNIQAGSTASGSTKVINIGTGGLSGSTTTIAIGSSTGTSTLAFNGVPTFNTAIPITSGGTNATTAIAAFNNLSPITSTGDLLIGNGANSNTRLPIGTSGYVLTSNGTTATWSVASPVTTAGDLIVGTGANATARLPIGTTGYVLTSNGTTATWQPTGAYVGVQSFSAGTTGLTPNIATTGAVVLGGTLGLANGGTNATTAQGAINNLAGATTSGQYLRGNGTNVVMSAIQAADVPTLNQNTTGTAAGLSATLAVLSGGTGVTTSTGSGSNVLNTRPTLTVTGSGFTLQDQTDNSKQANFDLSGLLTTTTYTYTLPAFNGTLASLAGSNTWAATQTFSSAINANAAITLNGATTSNTSLGANATTGTLTLGGTSQSGTMTIGQSTVAQTTNIQTGAISTGTKAINIGTGSAAGSTTTLTLGSTAGTSTTTINGTVKATGGWIGTGSAAGALGGVIQSIACERSGVGAVNQVMSYGNGASTLKGLRMPFAGKLIAATLEGVTVTGTITVQAYINGTTNASYQLTGTGAASDIGATQDFSASPLSFNAGDTLGWVETTAPSAANGFNVLYFVIYN